MLDVHDDGEELQFRRRHPIERPRHRIIERQSKVLAFGDQAELSGHRLGALLRDHLQTFAGRQARLDAAYDHVDSVGELRGKLLLTTVREVAQDEPRQEVTHRRRDQKRTPPPESREQVSAGGDQRDGGAEEIEFADPGVEPCLQHLLSNLATPLRLLVLLVLDRLQLGLNLLAAATVAFVRPAGGGTRAGIDHRGDPLAQARPRAESHLVDEITAHAAEHQERGESDSDDDYEVFGSHRVTRR